MPNNTKTALVTEGSRGIVDGRFNA